MVRWIVLACFTGIALAEGTQPKPKAQDYEVNAQSKNVAVGAEYMVHSFSGQGQTYLAKDYLVVEVALYPPKGEAIEIKPADFALRIDGKKPVLLPQPSTMVAANLSRLPWWQRGRQMGGGGGPVPSQVPGGQPPRGPLPPRAPDPGAPGGIDRPDPVKADEVVVESALPEGQRTGPISGFLYFAWKGKPSSIKTLELLYEDAVLKLK